MAWTQASGAIRRQARVTDARLDRSRDGRKPSRTAGARSDGQDITLRGLVIVISLAQIGLLVWIFAALPIAR